MSTCRVALIALLWLFAHVSSASAQSEPELPATRAAGNRTSREVYWLRASTPKA